jgi:hypothetical protein
MTTSNNRIFYATQGLLLNPCDRYGSNQHGWVTPLGVQSVGITTNIPLEQVFTLGQLEIYDNLENVPDISITVNKVIDGTLPLYLICMGGSDGPANASGKNIVELANNRVDVRLNVYADTSAAASGTAETYLKCTGMYLSNFSFTLPVDGNGTEDVTLVGNNRTWVDGASEDTYFTTHNKNTSNDALSVGTFRRYNFLSSTPSYNHLQSVKVSADLGREAIYELGHFAPYHRYVKFPLEVSSEFEIVAIGSDGRTATDAHPGNSPFESVNVVIGTTGVDGSVTSGNTLTLDLGSKNKLTSVNYAGGDTGGANVTMTYSFKGYNHFVVTGVGSFLTQPA